MNERQIRQVIAQALDALDRRAGRARRQVGRVLMPSLLGAGLALGGCGARPIPAGADGATTTLDLGAKPDQGAPAPLPDAATPPDSAPPDSAPPDSAPPDITLDSGADSQPIDPPIDPAYGVPMYGVEPFPPVDAGAD